MYEGAYTLGDFIKKLKTLDQETAILFEFGSATPTTFDSYRGYYFEIALGYDGSYGTNHITVAELLKRAEEALGSTFEGWKGGDYTMTENTNLFLANSGCTSDTHITDIVKDQDDYAYVMITKQMSFEG